MTWVRVAAVSVALAAATFAGVWVYRGATRDGADAAEPRGDELSVGEARHAALDQTVTVRGFVFIDATAGDLLCSQTTGGGRPACEGDVLRLDGLDASRLALEVAWSDGDVVLLGTTAGGARLVVKDVLPS
jgi:hypothetical protein